MKADMLVELVGWQLALILYAMSDVILSTQMDKLYMAILVEC